MVVVWGGTLWICPLLVTVVHHVLFFDHFQQPENQNKHIKKTIQGEFKKICIVQKLVGNMLMLFCAKIDYHLLFFDTIVLYNSASLFCIWEDEFVQMPY